MVQTRNPASQDEPVDPFTPPPPPPSTTTDQGLGQFMASQTQLMNAMMQNMNQMMTQQNRTAAVVLAMLNQNNQAAAMPLPPPPAFPQSKLVEFFWTHPPTFSSSSEPLDADDWLRSIKKKLAIIRCDDRERVIYVSHQLEGASAE